MSLLVLLDVRTMTELVVDGDGVSAGTMCA